MGAAIIIVMDGAADSLDVSGSLLRGTLLATLVIALLLVLFLRRDAFSQFGNLFSHGFGWFK